MPGDHTDALIGLALFVASELIGMNPRTRSNSVLQLVVHMSRELFPYELHRRQPPTRDNRPRITRLFQRRP